MLMWLPRTSGSTEAGVGSWMVVYGLPPSSLEMTSTNLHIWRVCLLGASAEMSGEVMGLDYLKIYSCNLYSIVNQLQINIFVLK